MAAGSDVLSKVVVAALLPTMFLGLVINLISTLCAYVCSSYLPCLDITMRNVWFIQSCQFSTSRE